MLDSLTFNIKFYCRRLVSSDAADFKKIRDANIEYLHHDIEYTLEESREYLVSGSTEYYGIFTTYHKLIGYIRFQHIDTDTCQIGMDLDPNFQSQGLGYYIYENILNVLQSAYKNVLLCVLETNTRAFNLYVKLGFTVVEHAPDLIERANGTRVGNYLMMLNR